MNRFLLKLRHHSVLKLSKLWNRKFGNRSRIAALAMLIGFTAAIASGVLHALVKLLEKFSVSLKDYGKWGIIIFLLLPLAGVVLSFFAQRIFGGPRYAKSLSPLILALNRRKTGIPLRETFNHIISSALAVGFGGSAGLEAPSVLTGAAIGANTSGFFGADRREKILMIGCGSAAAISAIFNSPIGGVLFAVEVLLPGFSVGALVPMLISSAVAMVTARVLFHHELALPAIPVPWENGAVPFYFFCGLFCAVIGVFVIRSVYGLTAFIKRRIASPHRRVFAGGMTLCVVLAFFPVLRGQGYSFVMGLFSGNMDKVVAGSPFLGHLPFPVLAILVILAAIFIKSATSVLTVECGGDGGIFAPTMFIGAFTGFAFARLVNLSGLASLQEANFVVIGMCGVFSAVLRAPLTGVFLIAEVTGSYILLVPLMIVSAVSWAAARHFEAHSIYRKALAESGLISDDRDQSMLQTLSVRVCVDSNFTALSSEASVHQILDIVENNPGHEFFPVLDAEKKLQGIVRLEQLTPVLFEPLLAESLLVFDLMESPRCVLSEDDDLARAVTALERCKIDFLPVKKLNGKFMGFVSAQDIFKLYRGLVRSEDY